MVVWSTTFCIGPFPRFNSYEQVAAGGGRRAILDKKKENNTANRDWKGAFRPWDDTYILHIDV